MPRYSNRSKEILATCDERLQKVFNRAIEFYDIQILEGHRPVERQMLLYAQGRSKPGSIVTNIDGVRTKGKHNYKPSKAIDVVPYPLDWNKRERFVFMAGIVLGIAFEMGIELRWGGDWNMNENLEDKNKPMDLPHFEVVD